jgi:large subunit ribosomal protein L17
MRHLKAKRKLGRTSAHRHALFSNMVSSLFQHGQLETTEPKAKELRSVAERAITWARSVSDLVGKAPTSMNPGDRMRLVHAKRMARRVVKHEESLAILFSSIGPSFAKRNGGYTRVLKTRFRPGDAAPMALVQLVDWKPDAPAGASATDSEKPKTKAKPAAGKATAEKPAKAEKASKGEKPAPKAKAKAKKSDD